MVSTHQHNAIASIQINRKSAIVRSDIGFRLARTGKSSDFLKYIQSILWNHWVFLYIQGLSVITHQSSHGKSICNQLINETNHETKHFQRSTRVKVDLVEISITAAYGACSCGACNSDFCWSTSRWRFLHWDSQVVFDGPRPICISTTKKMFAWNLNSIMNRHQLADEVDIFERCSFFHHHNKRSKFIWMLQWTRKNFR